MRKLQDFARETGVTDRAIQKHLKKYEKELEGLVERKGPNGTWLSDEACDFLRGKMKQLPPAVIDGDTQRENDKLKKQVDDLKDTLITLYAEHDKTILQLAEAQGAQRLLDAAEADKAALADKLAEREEEITQLRIALELERAKPWYKKLFAKGE